MSKIEVGSLVEELEIDEVARPLTSLIGDGMELLRDLVVGTHDRHRLRGRKAHLGEESGEISSELVLGFVRVTDLVVAQFELHGAPGPASIVELHLKGLHDVCPRHSRRARCSLLHESPGEARPSRRERILEVASELGEWLDSRGVEILGKSCASSVPQRHRTAALDHSLGQHLTDDNKRHPDTTTQRQSVAAFHVADALLQGTHARRRTRVAHDRRHFLTRCHSVVVISPSPRARFAASRRRSVSMRPRHSRMASATGCATSPS